MKRLLLCTILLIALIACKTIVYVYPTYTYPDQPKIEINDIKFETISDELDKDGMIELNKLLQAIDTYQKKWKEWASKMIEITTHKEEENE